MKMVLPGFRPLSHFALRWLVSWVPLFFTLFACQVGSAVNEMYDKIESNAYEKCTPKMPSFNAQLLFSSNFFSRGFGSVQLDTIKMVHVNSFLGCVKLETGGLYQSSILTTSINSVFVNFFQAKLLRAYKW